MDIFLAIIIFAALIAVCVVGYMSSQKPMAGAGGGGMSNLMATAGKVMGTAVDKAEETPEEPKAEEKKPAAKKAPAKKASTAKKADDKPEGDKDK